MLQLLLKKNVCFSFSSERCCRYFPGDEFTLEGLDFCGLGGLEVCFVLNSRDTYSNLNTSRTCVFYKYFPTPVLPKPRPSSSCSPHFNNSINPPPLQSCPFGTESWSKVLGKRDGSLGWDPHGKPLYMYPHIRPRWRTIEAPAMWKEPLFLRYMTILKMDFAKVTTRASRLIVSWQVKSARFQ